MTARRWRALGLIALWIAWIVIRAAGEVNDAVGAVSFLVLVGAVVLTWQWIEGRLKTLVIIALWMSYLAVVMVAFQLEEDITVWSVAAFLLWLAAIVMTWRWTAAVEAPEKQSA